ncbi:MAG: hypothetical protein Q8L07_15355 [Sediminibacterium sp.]|nr:hypothetical protein [Sediminibacterium sp.]
MKVTLKAICLCTTVLVSNLFINQCSAQETLQTVTTSGSTTNKTVELNLGGIVRNYKWTVDGTTMSYTDPLVVKGNLDGAAHILADGAIRFDRSSDIYESNAPSSLIMVYPPSGIPYIRRYGHDFTIFKIWSPTNSRNAYESTIALVNGDNEEEYLDLYNLSYPTAKNFGIRMQKRGTGIHKPFKFEYSDGITVYPVLTVSPDSSAAFTGNVSIGTTTPPSGYKLAVAGSVIVQSIKAKNPANWPDYVFDKSHTYRSLEDLDQYIQKNKHLPEIPSAKEVQQNGINLGDMDAKLLKKIEEITLYLIAQGKELKTLKVENEKLALKIQQLKSK